MFRKADGTLRNIRYMDGTRCCRTNNKLFPCIYGDVHEPEVFLHDTHSNDESAPNDMTACCNA